MGLCFSCRSTTSPFKDKKHKLCGNIHTNIAHFTTSEVSNGHFPTTVIVNSSPKLNGRINMANSFSNMNLSNSIKVLVSKQRKRYKQDGFNLDLTYITDRVIAMGYPASKIESYYRNDIDDVVNFFETKHKDHYKIYNLCSERSYDISKFQHRVEMFPFDDHNPPNIELIEPFCKSVHRWLSEHKDNVAVVHCKAGKGRTGTMICCYLLHSRTFNSAADALNYYGHTRTQNSKGVTIPSQKRYVDYYANLINNCLQYTPVALYIKEVILEPVPSLQQGAICFSISSQQNVSDSGDCFFKTTKHYKSPVFDVKKSQNSLVLNMDCCLPLSGDIKIEIYNKNKLRKKEKLVQFWFNTFFVRDEVAVCDTSTNNGGLIDNGSAFRASPEENTVVLRLQKSELDLVNKKDKQNKVFSSDFKVTVLLNKVPARSTNVHTWFTNPTNNRPQDSTPSESSEADTSEDDTNEDDDWDSVVERDNLDPRGVGYRLLSECEIASQLTSSSNNDQQPEILTA